MNIDINLNDSASLTKAIAQVQAYADQFSAKCSSVCERLAQNGKDVLTTTYTAALYAGTNDINVTAEPIDGGYLLSAHGSALGFIEFGTGIGYPLGAYADQVGAPAHGTFGKHKGMRPPWTYIGEPGNAGISIHSSPRGEVVKTYGNPPANAFPAAVESMRESFSQIVQEVFGV